MSNGNTHAPAAPAGVLQPTSRSTALDVVRAGAGRCVACGLCLPHCPTYRKTRSELESPRGRISLMLAVAKQELDATPQLESHLSLCLTCRACEVVCPAKVPFGEIMDATRAELAARRPALRQRLFTRALTLLTRPPWLAFVTALLRGYQRSGLQWLLRRSGILTLLGLADSDAELPRLVAYEPFATHYPAHANKRGAVALFTGCIARLTDAQTLHDAIRVLTRIGYDVHVPPTQSCCGALHRHSGDGAGANELMARNTETFAALEVEAIITAASGCGATLVEYEASAFTAKIVDISSFLQRVWPNDIALAPLAKHIAVHDACTLTNVLRAQRAPYDLLRRIPQAQVAALPENKFCCGAAGAYHLQHKDMAQSLRDDKIDALRQLAPDILVSSNVGCAMHLAAGIHAAGLAVEVVHPVSVIARQLTAISIKKD